MQPCDLSIILVNYNTFSLTCNCIRSVYQQTKNLNFEILLVDNASKECDPKKFLQEFPTIRLIALPENVGFGRGNNEAIKIADGNVLLLLNSDTVIFDNAIGKTYDYLMSQHHVGLVGCKLLNEDGSEQLSSYIPIRFPKINLLLNGNPILNKITRWMFPNTLYHHQARSLEFQKSNHECEAVGGAFMMLKKEVVDTCGAFDPDFHMYSEETEWCRNRISKHFKIMYYANASIIHLGGKSSGSIPSHKQSLLSSFLYNYKRGLVNYVLIFLIFIFNALSTVLVFPFFRKESRKSAAHELKSFAGIIPYLLFDIPRYGRGFGARKQVLLLKELRARG